MISAMLPSLVLPLSWVRYKSAPTQFADHKNAPGKDYEASDSEFEEPTVDEPATTPASTKVNEGDFKDGFTATAIRTAVQNDPSQGPLEVSKLRTQD